MAGSYLPPVVVEITGNMDGLVATVAKAKAALDSLKNSAGDIKIGTDVNTASIAKAALATDALTRATTRGTNAGRGWTRWIGLAHNLLTVFGANIVADTIGIIAFGIGAVAAFGPVITAVGNLGATYGELNPLQRVATVQITDFMHSFQAANNAGIFAVFTQLMNMVGQATGKAGGIMDQATIAFENFAAMLKQAFSSAPWQAMFARSSGVIQQDLTALFGLLTALINVIPALFHDFNGLGLAVIGGATAILHLIAIIGNGNAALVRFASMTFLVYRALRALGAFNSGSALRNMIAGMTGAVRSGGVLANTFQSISRFGFGTTAMLLTGLTPAMLGIVGVAGVVTGAILYMNFALKNNGIGLQNQISLMAQADNASGNNITGYQKLAQQLTALTNGTASLSAQDKQGIAATRGYAQASGQLTQAQQAAVQMVHTLSGNLTYLEQKYHLTQAQAYQLAKATGTDLTQAFNKGGGAAQATRMKIAAYEQTVKAAQNPTSALGYDMGLAANKAVALSDRVTALTNAFNALLTPFANVITDTVTWNTGNKQLEAAVDKSKGKVNDMGTALQQLSAGALASAINNTVNLSQATLQQTGSMAKAIQPVRNEIAVLEALHSKSSVVAAAIRNLQAYIDSLHSKSITLTTVFNSVGTPTGAYGGGGTGHATPPGGYASGTTGARPGWAWVGEKGPELAYMRGGEKVIPHQQSVAIARGYANGTGGTGQVIENVIMLDSKVLYKSLSQVTAYKNFQNNVRTPHGSAQGRMGTR